MGEYEYEQDMRLKACPFCGSETAPYVTRCWVEAMHDYSESQWQVVCNFNGGGCGGSSGVRTTDYLAIELWNRRASE